MNRQSIVNKSFRGLYKQGKKSEFFARDLFIPSNTQCRYRANMKLNGEVKCAIGHLIPDSLYQRTFEGHGTNFLVDPCWKLNRILGFTKQNKDSQVHFLDDLQNLHDELEVDANTKPAFRKALVAAFEDFCKNYQLKMPKIPKLKT